MKKILAFLLAAVLCVTMLAACDSAKTAEETTAAAEEIAVVDENGVKAVVKSFGEYKDEVFSFANALVIEVTNDTDRTLSVSLDETSVNGYMIGVDNGYDVEPHTTKIYPALFNELQMRTCGITTVADLSFVFRAIVESEGGSETVVRSMPVTMNVNPDYQQEYDESGAVVYDKDGVKLIAKEIYDDEYMGKSVRMLVINTTGKTLDIAAQMEGKLNGGDAEISFYTTVAAGKRSVEGLSFYEADAKEISEVIFSLAIFDYNTAETIVEESDPITVTFD